MNKTTLRLGAAAAAIVVTTAVVAGISSASGFMGKGMGMFSGENREAMESALENKNYDAWKELVGDNRMSEGVTAENFSKFASAHELMQAGKQEEAKAIFEELGLNMGRGRMGGRMEKGMGGQGMMNGNNTAAMTALDNNDFSAWQTAVSGSSIAEKINAGNFSRLVEAHNLQKQARSIMEELGIEKGFGQRF